MITMESLALPILNVAVVSEVSIVSDVSGVFVLSREVVGGLW